MRVRGGHRNQSARPFRLRFGCRRKARRARFGMPFRINSATAPGTAFKKLPGPWEDEHSTRHLCPLSRIDSDHIS